MTTENPGARDGETGPFDRVQLRLRRDRAAANFAAHSFLAQEVSASLAERLGDIKRRFPVALDLGCRDGRLAAVLSGRNGIERLIQCDLSPAMVARASGPYRLVADEEWLPFAGGRLDLVISALSLHWVNDLPGALIQIRRALRPDGLFLGAIFGGDSLTELRQALARAESELEGGISPRIAPFVEIRDLGTLLQRAGFALPVVDSDTVNVTYPDALALMRDLRGMGESNVLRERRPAFTRRRTLMAAAEHYRDMFGDENGRIPATFQVLYLSGWCPHESQQQALKPGSGKVSLATALSSGELPD
ncbi:MAG: methyltransferase domain-containing protein [Alphaproteobacteria bacterium]